MGLQVAIMTENVTKFAAAKGYYDAAGNFVIDSDEDVTRSFEDRAQAEDLAWRLNNAMGGFYSEFESAQFGRGRKGHLGVERSKWQVIEVIQPNPNGEENE